MKVSNIKKRLFLGTMFLYLLGSTHPLEASLPESIFFAQTNSKVSGTVKDATGVVPGANLIEKGNPTNGTVSDINGNFSISIPEGSTLVVSAIGYKTQEITITNPSAQLNILLEEDVLLLDDVVVTALGIRRDRKALGYGLEEVQGEAFTKAREINVINSMAGRVAGLVVSQTAGGPSGSTRVLLRGNTEITGNNQPLYVVDGVPLDNTNYGSAGTYGGYDLGDGISAINPDDIENISVLKGPAASALYGSRASHGVILITTKKADDKQKVSVEYNGTLSFDTQLAKWEDVQQVYGMGSSGTYSIDAVSNTNKSWGPKADGSNMLRYFDGVERPYKIIPDNTSNFFRRSEERRVG